MQTKVVGNASVLLLIGVAVHALYFLSVFDVYFRSPVEVSLLEPPPGSSATEPVSHEREPPAHRLVLIVADGLRADTLFEFMGRDERYHARWDDSADKARMAHWDAAKVSWPRANQSYLRMIAEEVGSWGVAHTRVPTETRPGHVALVAGMYEDVSAVTRGWQANPTDFDHVFRHSTATYAWGHEDVVGLFARDETSRHKVRFESPPHEEDFAQADLGLMDVWVFNRAAEFLRSNVTTEMRSARGLVFFLHLGALDALGHVFRPHSREYWDDAALVDRSVAGLVEIFDDAFGHDGRTAWIFSSDHGMTSRGAHGDGNPEATRTPLVAWGAGVRGPTRLVVGHGRGMGIDSPQNSQSPPPLLPRPLPSGSRIDTGMSASDEAELTSRWGLSHLERRDVAQADVASLMASLLGVPVPAHSVGFLPVALLNPGPARAAAVWRNAAQLFRQLDAKDRARRTRALAVCFSPYPGLEMTRVDLDEARAALERTDWDLSEILADRVARSSVDGLRWYQIYDRPALLGSVAVGYLGYVALVLGNLDGRAAAREVVDMTNSNLLVLKIVTGVRAASVLVSGLTAAMLIAEHAPVTHVLYPASSLGLWSLVSPSALTLRLPSMWSISLALVLTQLVVWGYSRREFLSLVVCYGAFAYSLLPSSEARDRTHLAFSLALVVLAAFLAVPLDVNPHLGLVIASGLISLVVARFVFDVRLLNFGLVVAALLLAVRTDIAMAKSSFSSETVTKMSASADDSAAAAAMQVVKLGSEWRAASWIVFLAAPLAIRRFGRGARLDDTYVALAAQYALLSVTYELAFFSVLAVTLNLWQRNERRRRRRSSTETWQRRRWRRAMSFLIGGHVSFFATGNFVTLASFHLSSTYRFTTVYRPFLMAALLVWKLLIPYILVAIATSLASDDESADDCDDSESATHLFLRVVVLCDLIALPLLFSVRDEGSWLAIGESISQYGFACAHLILVPLVYVLSTKLF